MLIFIFLLLFTPCFADETFTITTYYPSPYGSYNELRSKKMAIGDTYIDNDVVSWDSPCALLGGGCTANDTALIVEGKVGIGTANPQALLELSSTTQGFLLPRMNMNQRNAIASPVQGLVIYNTGTNQLEVYNGSEWKSASEPAHGMQVFNNPGTYSFIIPDGVTIVTAEVWGGGGGGTGSISNCSTVTMGGDGGGGGGYGKQVIAVTPGGTYTMVVGAGGTGAVGNNCPSCGCGFGDGARGQKSSVKSGTTVLVSASEGIGGEGGGYMADGGTSTAAVSASGGNGGAGAADNNSCQPDPIGGDGGSGGAGGNGGSATSMAHCVTNGISGNAPGGGGSGASGRTGGRGGDGAPGRVVISW